MVFILFATVVRVIIASKDRAAAKKSEKRKYERKSWMIEEQQRRTSCLGEERLQVQYVDRTNFPGQARKQLFCEISVTCKQAKK
jgi:hypothetical protein